MKHFIAFCRRNRLFAALLAAELAVVCALAAGLFGAPYKLALTPGDFTNTLPDIAAADDDGLKIWNQIGYHSDEPMTFSADNIALPSGAYEVTVRYFSCQTPDAPTFNMLNAAGSLTFASERSPAAVRCACRWRWRASRCWPACRCSATICTSAMIWNFTCSASPPWLRSCLMGSSRCG